MMGKPSTRLPLHSLRKKKMKSKGEVEDQMAYFLSSGVKKLFLAAVVPGVPENHFNQRALLEAVGFRV